LSSPAQTLGPSVRTGSNRWSKGLVLAIVLLIAIGFVVHYVFRYYLNYNKAAFTDPTLGGSNYWRVRGWLMLHITSGMLALLIGPFQFSTRVRQRYLALHRLSGRVYVIAVLFGCVGAFRLATVTDGGKAWGFGLDCLAFAWATTTLMAYYAIRRKQISIHKEWMIRSYVVTFAFVTFRLLNDYPPMMNWLPASDRPITYVWASWALPLVITEVILQLVRMKRLPARFS
jgi:uncharacterized membrane protein